MAKNVIVTDELGKQIGLTYPKRARGLVKNGRAEYVGDCEIRMLDTHAPIVDNDNTEVNIMSNVIDFNARDFSFDKSCESNVGSRMFMTGSDGKVREVFEIGDWNWNWSQIKCEKQLEKNTDYIFRFELIGGFNQDRREKCDLVIFSDENWEDRYIYPLTGMLYQPVLSKRDKDGSFRRVYEVQFNSGEAEKTTFLFYAQHAVARILAAMDNESYAEMEDAVYEDSAKDTGCQERDNLSNLSDFVNGLVIDLSGANIGASVLNGLMQKVGSKGVIDLSGANVYDDSYNANNDVGGVITGTYEGCGAESSDDGKTAFNNVEMTEIRFAELLAEIDDGQKSVFENVTIHYSDAEELPDIGQKIDGSILCFENITLTSRALSMIVAKLGDGCIVNFGNATVTTEGIQQLMAGKTGDGVNMFFENATIPKSMVDYVCGEMGDGCNVHFGNIRHVEDNI